MTRINVGCGPMGPAGVGGRWWGGGWGGGGAKYVVPIHVLVNPIVPLFEKGFPHLAEGEVCVGEEVPNLAILVLNTINMSTD